MVTVALHAVLHPPAAARTPLAPQDRGLDTSTPADSAPAPPPLELEFARRGLDSVTVDGDAPHVVQRAGASPSIEAVVVAGAPDADTLRAIADATEARPELAVVLLGPTDYDVDMLVSLASGVAGYLPPTAAPGDIADAVTAVLAGAIVAPPEVTGPLVRSLRAGSRRMVATSRSGRAALTAREWEVLVLLRQGRSTGEMAHRLVVAAVTVRSHVAALVAKFGVSSRDELAAPWPSPPA